MSDFNKTIVLVTGGFDPMHSGHIKYLQAAKSLGDRLIVGVNSDAWLSRKKGSPFMPYKERAEIVRNIQGVDFVINFDDSDGSARHAIWMVQQSYPQSKIIFANGGDRTDQNIPEMDVNDDNVKFVFGVGGFDKANSSSWILQEWKAPKTQRDWGYYRVLHEVPGTKVKELTVNPGRSISMQRHFERAEYWHVSSGRVLVHSQTESGYLMPTVTLNTHDNYKVAVNDWHRISNPFDEPATIVEIQYGTRCEEEDIERKV